MDMSEVRAQLDSFFASEDGRRLLKRYRDTGLPETRPSPAPNVVSVQESCGILPAEEKWLKERSNAMHKAREKFWFPRDAQIGIAFSGGGMRAMYESLAFLSAFQTSGVLDAVEYVSGLSGSVWALLACMQSGKPPMEVQNTLRDATRPSVQFSTNRLASLRERLSSFTVTLQNKIVELYANNTLFESVTDLYAELIRFSIFDTLLVRDYYLNDLNHNATKLPYAIMSALISENQEWVEITNSSVSVTKLSPIDNIIPSGQQSNNGQERIFSVAYKYAEKRYTIPINGIGVALCAWQDTHGTQSEPGLTYERSPLPKCVGRNDVAFLCAAAGSAFCAEAVQVWESIRSGFSAPLALAVDTMLRYTPLGHVPVVPHARIFDFRGANTLPHAQMSIVDAGMLLNLAVPPLLRRSVDILIVVDSSAGIRGAELINASKWATQHGFSFPKIPPLEQWENKPVLFFPPLESEHSAGPRVIYISGPADVATYHTTKWFYRSEEIASIFTDVQTLCNEHVFPAFERPKRYAFL